MGLKKCRTGDRLRRDAKRKDPSRGQSIAEVVGLMPLLILLGLASVELGAYAFSAMQVKNLARELGYATYTHCEHLTEAEGAPLYTCMGKVADDKLLIAQNTLRGGENIGMRVTFWKVEFLDLDGTVVPTVIASEDPRNPLKRGSKIEETRINDGDFTTMTDFESWDNFFTAEVIYIYQPIFTWARLLDPFGYQNFFSGSMTLYGQSMF